MPRSVRSPMPVRAKSRPRFREAAAIFCAGHRRGTAGAFGTARHGVFEFQEGNGCHVWRRGARRRNIPPGWPRQHSAHAGGTGASINVLHTSDQSRHIRALRGDGKFGDRRLRNVQQFRGCFAGQPNGVRVFPQRFKAAGKRRLGDCAKQRLQSALAKAGTKRTAKGLARA